MPKSPTTFVLCTPAGSDEMFPSPKYVGSINDRPEDELRSARKFSSPADAELYKAGRPHLASTVVVPVESGGR